ncbi:hypothetical protein TIFTF001_008773 [Ficus carica]|uniref:Late embryogenesis abundant protein LEA-2 subgroup domain-containing protein n=1 Tax=Ficus carica TaxID=3494 RepID=A0AA88D0U9_FICCA|nr:hypothetical protein TIFTF001_008773 [Ficus carica]
MAKAGRSRCGCCCVMGWIFGIIAAIVVLLGIVVGLFFAIVNPQKMKIQINDATITKFNLTEANQTHWLHYDMEFNVTLRNPNRIMGLYYDHFTPGVYYQTDENIMRNYVDSKFMNVVYQGKKNTTVIRYRFNGKREVYLLEAGERVRFIDQFEKEKRAGFFSIDWKVEFRTRVKLGAIRIGIFRPKVRCGSSLVPFVGGNNGQKRVNVTSDVAKCRVKFKASSYDPLA